MPLHFQPIFCESTQKVFYMKDMHPWYSMVDHSMELIQRYNLPDDTLYRKVYIKIQNRCIQVWRFNFLQNANTFVWGWLYLYYHGLWLHGYPGQGKMSLRGHSYGLNERFNAALSVILIISKHAKETYLQ